MCLPSAGEAVAAGEFADPARTDDGGAATADVLAAIATILVTQLPRLEATVSYRYAVRRFDGYSLE